MSTNLFEGVVNRVTVGSRISSSPFIRSNFRRKNHLRRPEELLQEHVHAPQHLGHEEVLSNLLDGALLLLVPSRGRPEPEVLQRRAGRGRIGSPRDEKLCGSGAEKGRGSPDEGGLASRQRHGRRRDHGV
jgi:hypothetical protein